MFKKDFLNQRNNLSNIASLKEEVARLNNAYLNSIDYRQAFMQYVLKNEINENVLINASEITKTTDVGVLIPTTITEKIISKIETAGMIYSRVTKTNYECGVSIPTSSVKPVATWVAQGAVSDTQKKATGAITFAYHKLRCSVAQTLESSILTIDVFETSFVDEVAQAMLKAIEQSIISGNGIGQFKGILTETAITNQVIEISDIDYNTILRAEGALPISAENGSTWLMTKKTFMAFVGIVDSKGQPIARENDGLETMPERTLLGREVILNDYMDSYTPVGNSGKTIAVIFNLKDYFLNTAYDMTIKKFEDNDTENLITKAILLADGKALSNQSLVKVNINRV